MSLQYQIKSHVFLLSQNDTTTLSTWKATKKYIYNTDRRKKSEFFHTEFSLRLKTTNTKSTLRRYVQLKKWRHDTVEPPPQKKRSPEMWSLHVHLRWIRPQGVKNLKKKRERGSLSIVKGVGEGGGFEKTAPG